jgi:glycosyltransferase involved in cell wall biosynthesis
MSVSDELTIVIPAKNEEKLLPGLLDSLVRQDYPLLRTTRVYLADAWSTDHTVLAAADYGLKLCLKVIPGGLPSVGRNAGARLARSKYVLFLDADLEIADTTLIRRSVETMKEKRLHCLTTDIQCSQGSPADHLLYLLNNIAQRGSHFTRPFATGMYMMVEKARFDELGGFDERALYAEDYQLTRQIDRRRFRVIGGGVQSTNRRFKKMGHKKIIRMFLKTAWNGRRPEYFRNSLHQAYWETY